MIIHVQTILSLYYNMKNFILQSKSRKIFNQNIRQRTKDSFLCISDLTNTFGNNSQIYGWSQNQIVDILLRDKAAERIYYILEDSYFINVGKSTFTEMCKKDGLIKVLENFKLYQTTGKAENKVTFADPYIWLYCAMELNPMIYSKAVKWLEDDLVIHRLEDAVNSMELNPMIYSKAVKWLRDGLIIHRLEDAVNYSPLMSAVQEKFLIKKKDTL